MQIHHSATAPTTAESLALRPIAWTSGRLTWPTFKPVPVRRRTPRRSRLIHLDPALTWHLPAPRTTH